MPITPSANNTGPPTMRPATPEPAAPQPLEGLTAGQPPPIRIGSGPDASGPENLSTLAQVTGPSGVSSPAGPLSPSLTAGVGFEIEVPNVKVIPALPRKSILIKRDTWQLKTDELDEKQCDIEFVTKPFSSMCEADQAAKEIIAFVRRVRNRVSDTQKKTINLSDVDDHPQIR